MPFKSPERIRAIKSIFCVAAFAAIVSWSFSCKKIIEQQKKNIIVNAITNGRWYVELYKDTTGNVTGEFSGYEFQFYEAGTVDGIKGTATQTGTWATDIANYTITAAFPATANDTLKRLNYTWKITDSYLDYVEAKTTTSNGDDTLHLRKK